MEIEGEDGSKTALKNGSTTEFGRGLGFQTEDRSVSRHHVSLRLLKDESGTNPDSEPRVQFEVTGKNPVWVLSNRSGEISVFKRFEKGELEGGDKFCVSGKNPVWFALKKKELEDDLTERLEICSSNGGSKVGEDMNFDCIDVSDIDPVKEFGFLVRGHEFDQYPKKMIRHIKDWDWFLEEPRKDSDDDDGDNVNKKQGKGLRRKRKKDEDNDDDEWAGESEDDKELITKVRKVQKPKYSTRSKDRNTPLKGTGSKNSAQRRTIRADDEDDEDEEEEEDEDTLGGFIVGDGDDVVEEEEEEEESDEDEEEEEEIDEDDDDDIDD